MKTILAITAAALTSCGTQYEVETKYGSYSNTLDGEINPSKGKLKLKPGALNRLDARVTLGK